MERSASIALERLIAVSADFTRTTKKFISKIKTLLESLYRWRLPVTPSLLFRQIMSESKDAVSNK